MVCSSGRRRGVATLEGDPSKESTCSRQGHRLISALVFLFPLPQLSILVSRINLHLALSSAGTRFSYLDPNAVLVVPCLLLCSRALVVL